MGNQSHYGFSTLYWGKKSYIDGCLAQTYLPYDQIYLQYEVVRRRPIIVLYIFSRNNFHKYRAVEKLESRQTHYLKVAGAEPARAPIHFTLLGNRMPSKYILNQ